MDNGKVLKAIADDTRMKILKLLLKRNYCVRALAKELHFTEATVSQHLKILREAGLLVGEKRGYFMHYDVERSVLHELASEIDTLAKLEREVCTQNTQDCSVPQKTNCHKKDDCSPEVQEFCHGKSHHSGQGDRNGKI